MYKDTAFKNSSFVGNIDEMDRIMQIDEINYQNLRFWKEYFFRFRDKIPDGNSLFEESKF